MLTVVNLKTILLYYNVSILLFIGIEKQIEVMEGNAP